MIYPSKLVFMQRVQQSAARGFYFFITGEVEEQKFTRLRERFQIFYSIDESKYSRHRRRKRAEAATVLHAIKHDQKIHFCLMSTTGKGKVHEREKLSDLRNKWTRLHSPCEKYQLLHDSKSWSWLMTRDYFRKWRERIHICCSLPPNRRKVAHVDNQLRELNIEKVQDRLYAEPGFRLIRAQIGQLVVYMNKEWLRLRPASDPRPSQRTFLNYIRMLPTHQKTMSEKMVANAKKRALNTGQSIKERQKLAQQKREFSEKRRRFKKALKQQMGCV